MISKEKYISPTQELALRAPNTITNDHQSPLLGLELKSTVTRDFFFVAYPQVITSPRPRRTRTEILPKISLRLIVRQSNAELTTNQPRNPAMIQSNNQIQSFIHSFIHSFIQVLLIISFISLLLTFILGIDDYTYLMNLEEAKVKEAKGNKYILTGYSREQSAEVQLYKISRQLKKGAQFSIIRKAIKKNEQTHPNLVHYQCITFIDAKQLGIKGVLPGNYLALMRINQPLHKFKWKLMRPKQKISRMLAIAKAVQSLHAKKITNLSLNLKNIFITSDQHIKIASILTHDISQIVQDHLQSSIFMDQNPQLRYQFNIWSLAIIFIQILINGRLKISWEEPQQTLKSIKSFIKSTSHIIFYSIRTIIKKMIRNDDHQLTIDRIVNKLKKLNKLEETELITRQKLPKIVTIPLITSINKNEVLHQSLSQYQRIIIIGIFQLFITLHPDKQLIAIELINPEMITPLLITHYTYSTLPETIKRRYKNLSLFFHFLQHVDPQRCQLSKDGSLIIKLT